MTPHMLCKKGKASWRSFSSWTHYVRRKAGLLDNASARTFVKILGAEDRLNESAPN